jgi:predicted Ser/Thr protein kinase
VDTVKLPPLDPPPRSPITVAAAPLKARALVVHDDLEMRLKLADLVRSAAPTMEPDTCTRTAYEQLPVERVRSYKAVFFVIEFAHRQEGQDPLMPVARLRDQAPKVVSFVVARGGDERSAVRSIKSGANDYWPVHCVAVDELAEVLRPLTQLEPVGRAGSNTATARGEADAKLASPIPGYRLIKKIAQSSSAVVYLAESEELPQTVALKVQWLVDADPISDHERQRFLRECELLSTLNHRSIADVFDFGLRADCYYLALEYFPCGSLRERLKNPLSESDALDYAEQLAEALKVVHAAGIMHRDLKPSNLMLTDDNRLVLIDFGLARTTASVTNITRPDLRVGTPYYMSPEQIDGKEPDLRCDLYSVGIILFEMLTGVLPFRGQSVAEIVQHHRNAALPRLPSKLLRYQGLIDRLLAKRPDDRYASTIEFLDTLRALRGAASGSDGTSALTGSL